MKRLLILLILLLGSGCGASSYESSPMKAGHSTYSPPAVTTAGAQLNQVSESDSSRGRPTHKAVSKKSSLKPSQMMVRNAWLTLELDDEDQYASTIQQIAAFAKNLDGYIAVENRNSITIRIPSAKLDGVLESIGKLGEISQNSIQVTDVSANFVDLEIRIDNLTKLKTRLQELILQGQNVKEVLEVEKELARVTGELERLEGQMRLMKNQISFATISVTLDTSVSPGPVGWVFYGLYSGVKWLFVWD